MHNIRQLRVSVLCVPGYSCTIHAKTTRGVHPLRGVYYLIVPSPTNTRIETQRDASRWCFYTKGVQGVKDNVTTRAEPRSHRHIKIIGTRILLEGRVIGLVVHQVAFVFNVNALLQNAQRQRHGT